jgi:hypothetical protein
VGKPRHLGRQLFRLGLGSCLGPAHFFHQAFYVTVLDAELDLTTGQNDVNERRKLERRYERGGNPIAYRCEDGKKYNKKPLCV